jgi:hypothetical protein
MEAKMKTLNNQEELKRQWMEALGPGWPCKVVNKSDELLCFLTSIMESTLFFVHNKKYLKNECIGISYKNYRPLSTPLDFILPDAEKIKIEHSKFIVFLNTKGIKISYHIYWPNCPEGMRGKTFRIPDDWRPK